MACFIFRRKYTYWVIGISNRGNFLSFSQGGRKKGITRPDYYFHGYLFVYYPLCELLTIFYTLFIQELKNLFWLDLTVRNQMVNTPQVHVYP